MIPIKQCPLCASELIKAYDAITRSGRRMELSRCSGCASLVRDPFFDKEELAEIYGSYPTHVSHYELPPGEAGNIAQRLARIERYAQGKGRFLEIGFGRGFFLRMALRAGWDVRGIEYEGSARENTLPEISEHIDFIKDESELENLPADGFDVICSYQVFEHFLDPLRMFSAMAQALKPGGLLVVNTPNATSLGARIHRERWTHNAAPEHFVIPSECVMRTMSEDQDLSVEKVFHGGPPFFMSRSRFEEAKASVGGGETAIADKAKRHFSPRKLFKSPLASSLARTIVYALGLGDNLELIARRRVSPQSRG